MMPDSAPIRLSNLTRTKTVATVGPASSQPEMMAKLLRAGVDVFRLNMAHGSRETHQRAVDDVRATCRTTGLPAGILVDLSGPKIRLGELFEDPLTLDPGMIVTFVRGDESNEPTELTCSYPALIDEIAQGDQIMLCDGLIRLHCEAATSDRLSCRVVDGGSLRSRQGVNLPGVNLGVEALQETDRSNATWAAENGIEFVSLSFVRHSHEIEELKRLLSETAAETHVIAKIEKREALEDLENIVRASDAIMVARGDLGVEIEIEKTPLAQKRIIRVCQSLGKPVIVATQMLESMHTSKRPTRAEVSDVANAILDGADACMLSGETAIGEHPEASVAMMRKIQLETEQLLAGRESRLASPELMQLQGVSEAVVFGAAQIARRVAAKLVVISTSSGTAALAKSKQRDFIPTVAITDQPHVRNQMCLYWGITPVLMESLDSDVIRNWIHQYPDSGLGQGDRIVYVVDTAFWPGVHETVMVGQVP